MRPLHDLQNFWGTHLRVPSGPMTAWSSSMTYSMYIGHRGSQIIAKFPHHYFQEVNGQKNPTDLTNFMQMHWVAVWHAFMDFTAGHIHGRLVYISPDRHYNSRTERQRECRIQTVRRRTLQIFFGILREKWQALVKIWYWTFRPMMDGVLERCPSTSTYKHTYRHTDGEGDRSRDELRWVTSHHPMHWRRNFGDDIFTGLMSDDPTKSVKALKEGG